MKAFKPALLLTIIFLTENTLLAQAVSSFTDLRDGRIYKTVKIENQIWMGENLSADRFQNGDLIPEAKTQEEWEKAEKNKQPVWCYYENKPGNGMSYGKLYNYYAITDKRILAPKGYHISTGNDWDSLLQHLGGFYNAGEKIKNTTGWAEKGPINTTNTSKFNGLPGGWRSHDGTFYYEGSWATWWTSTKDGPRSNWVLILSANNPDLYWRSSDYFNEGYSVRCVKD